MLALAALLISVFAFHVSTFNAMPYQVPLQGRQGGKRTLVIVDDMGITQSHSIFFENLSSQGHKLTFVQAESPDLVLKKFGVYLHDNIILFAPTVEEFNTITIQDILEFNNEGGNLLIAAQEDVSDTIRLLAASCGADFDEVGSKVQDHFSYESSVDDLLDHSAILVNSAVLSTVILGDYAKPVSPKPVLYRGIGHTIDDKNILAVKVLWGNPTTYSADAAHPIQDFPESVGADTLLVTAIQARNNARILISGSLEFFSNSFFRTSMKSSGAVGNELFCREVMKWVFGESGVLRFRDVTHHQADGTPPDVILHEKERPDLPLSLYPDPEITRNSLVYRIKEEIVYSMIVEQYSNGTWTPFSASDMQMEFVMLDPYVRKTLSSDPTTGRFWCQFSAPDNYGVFKFRVLYRRPGYSVLHAETQVSIRPFKHNEYERFIFSAFPYYSSALSGLVAFFVFSTVFLFSAD